MSNPRPHPQRFYEAGLIVRDGGGRLGQVQEYRDGRVILRGLGPTPDVWHTDPDAIEPATEIETLNALANKRSWERFQ
ncbi:hypothetical protein ABT160_14910 [Streptomyces sp. NPDC001941]|uniref:hypothetical protein n=1 Tax=Streptomyces sp. NPDC001941 TaxID=3154659 RepID=UPI0033264542